MDIFYLPKQVAVDSTGAPLAGAKLEFYQAGTTTPTDTYTTAARDVAHTNPVVADSEGVFAAIYLGTASDYKAVLKTSGDVTVWTEDNIPNAAVLGSLISTGSIPTAALAAKAVTLAKMADIPRGSMYVGGPSNRPVTLPLGDGKIPQGNGTDIVASDVPLPAGYRSGVTLSLNASDSDHDIDFAAGVVRDDTNTVNIVCPALTKRGDATFSAGTGNGMLSTGTIGNSTEYYVFAVAKADGADPDYITHTTTDPIGDGDMPSDYIYAAILNDGVPLLTDGGGNWINAMNGKYTSALQTITSNGTLALAHPFGTRPRNIQGWLICETADLNYSIGDIVKAPSSQNNNSSTTTWSAVIKPTDSGIGVRYGNAASVFALPNGTTGAWDAITISSWKFYVEAEK